MATHSVFISHSSVTKELARQIYYNAISNGVSVWYDEALLTLGDELRDSLIKGIENSASFLLLHSKAAMDKPWVPLEMAVARKKYEKDNNFKIRVVKLDDEPLPDKFWNRFLYEKWNSSDQGGSIIKILEALTGKRGIVAITASSVLTSDPSSHFVNQSATIAEHTRNYVLWYLCHIKKLMQSVVSVAYEQELRDTLEKLLHLFLFENIPAIHGGVIPVEPGVFELIHANRMRVPPRITVNGLPDKYKWELVQGNELFSRIRILEANSDNTVSHPVPLAISVELDAEL